MTIKQIRTIDIEYRILKHTSVMLMPRINKFKVKSLDELIRALKIEKVWGRFQDDMLRNYKNIMDNIPFGYTEFFDGVLKLIEADFIHKGQESEERVRIWLHQKGWMINPYSDKTAYSEEAKGIDIVCSKYNPKTSAMVWRNISVKSPGFWRYNPADIIIQLDKMIKANAWLFISGVDVLNIYNPEQIQQKRSSYEQN